MFVLIIVDGFTTIISGVFNTNGNGGGGIVGNGGGNGDDNVSFGDPNEEPDIQTLNAFVELADFIVVIDDEFVLIK